MISKLTPVEETMFTELPEKESYFIEKDTHGVKCVYSGYPEWRELSSEEKAAKIKELD